MTSLEMVKKTVKALDNKKAQDIQVIKIDDLSPIADYFVIATGSSTTQVKALADEVDYQMSQAKIEPKRVEGYQSATWILLDYGDVVVHVFFSQARDFYSLERLWSDGQNLDVAALLAED